MRYLASVAGVLLLVAAYASADSTIEISENKSKTLSMRDGPYETQKLYFMARANATYNVRITRLWEPYTKRGSTHRVCLSSSPYTGCSLDTNITSAQQGLYSAYFQAKANKLVYITVASKGESFSYAIRVCRGNCTERCPEDCNGHGACLVTKVCSCDKGANGTTCDVVSNSTTIDFEDFEDAVFAMFGVFMMAVLSFTGFVFSTFFPCIVVSMCVCCAAVMSARSRRGRVIATAQQRQQQLELQQMQRQAQNNVQPQARAPAQIYVPLPPPVSYARPANTQPRQPQPQPQQPVAQTPAQPPRQQQPPPPPPLYVSLYPSLA